MSNEGPAGLQALFAPLLRELEQSSRRREGEAAQADPLGHKLTRVMDNTSYRYYPAGKDGRGRLVRFCWSVHPNAAGFYLGWREVRGKKTVKRDMWLSRRVRRRVVEIAERRAGAYQRRRAESPYDPPSPPRD